MSRRAFLDLVAFGLDLLAQPLRLFPRRLGVVDRGVNVVLALLQPLHHRRPGVFVEDGQQQQEDDHRPDGQVDGGGEDVGRLGLGADLLQVVLRNAVLLGVHGGVKRLSQVAHGRFVVQQGFARRSLEVFAPPVFQRRFGGLEALLLDVLLQLFVGRRVERGRGRLRPQPGPGKRGEQRQHDSDDPPSASHDDLSRRMRTDHRVRRLAATRSGALGPKALRCASRLTGAPFLSSQLSATPTGR